MSTQVTITSDTCTLEIQAAPLVPGNPAMEFASGSFKGSVDERRVAFVNMAIPTGSKRFSLRFEFTDPSMATVDLWGSPLFLTAEDRIRPYTESPRTNPDVSK